MHKNKLSNFTPDQIAEFIAEDGLITESYNGLHVNPGNSPIDYLISAVERNYTDFDVNNPAFIRLAKAIFSKHNVPVPQDNAGWESLIKSSSQTDQLKSLLLSQLGGPGATASKTGPKGVKVTLRSGVVIEATETGDIGKDWIYLAIGPAGKWEKPVSNVGRMMQLSWFLGYNHSKKVQNPRTKSTRNTAMYRKYAMLKTV